MQLNLTRLTISVLCSVVLSTAAPAIAGAAMKHKKAPTASLLPDCIKPSALPSPHCGRTPTPAFDTKGRLWVVFSQNGHVYIAASDDEGKTFQPPLAVNRIPETIYDDGENRPKLAFGRDGELFVSWTHKISGRYAGDIRFARSLDGGQTFETPLIVNDDHAPISHRFDSMIVDDKGRIYLSWIDKRDLAAAKQTKTAYTGAAIYYAVSTDNGKSFAFNRKLADHSCECCRIAMAVDHEANDENGKAADEPIIILWRHVYPVNIRDHAIARLGVNTSAIEGLPQRATDDGWLVEGCPHHGPSMSIDPQHKVHMVWFTQGKKHPGLNYGRYDMDKGQFDFQQSIDTSASAARPQIITTDTQVFRSWKRFNGVDTELLVSHSDDQGISWSEPSMVTKTSNGSDHPVLIAYHSRVFLSWHTLAEGYRLFPLDKTVTPVTQVKHVH